ncbi:MAG: radical SAM protein [Planctomycetota bacterium]
MRVLLAAAPHRDTFGYSMPPPGLLRLGGALERAGFDVALEDLPHRVAAGVLPADDGLGQAAAELLMARGRFDAIGLSVMGATLPIAIAIAHHLRERAPGVRLLLGGPGTTGVDHALLERFDAFDALVRGEGEVTLVELLERWRRNANLVGVAGVTWRAPDGVRREPDRRPLDDLGTLAPLAWHLLEPFAAYSALAGGDEGLVPIDSGRGCVFDCSFCTIGRFWSRRSRVVPVDALLRQILDVATRPGAAHAYLCHDIFGANREHALELCHELELRGAPVPWECRARVDHLDDELVRAMSRAGCYRVLLGIESASPAVRARNSKNMAPDVDVLAAVRRLVDAGIVPILSLILGLPGEGEPELRASLDLVRDAAQLGGVNVSLHLVNPQPGCGLGEEFGASSRPVADIPPDMALGAGTTRAELELIAAHPDLFSSFALLTGLAGGEAHLRRLYAIAQGLPPLLERRPRTFQRLGAALGLDTLDLFDALATTDLETLAANDPWIVATAAWEHALEHAVEAHATPLALDVDPTRSRDAATGPVHLAIVRQGERVRTTRISAVLAHALARAAFDDEANHPAEALLRQTLHDAGLAPARTTPA